jgi:NADP-dependent 3-hydroxy acid dehydrogenase YdfG
VVFIGHDFAIRQRVHTAAYGTAKGGLAAMVVNLRTELQGTGVRASIVNPGQASTAMGSHTSAEASWDLTRHSSDLQGRHVARAVAFVIDAPCGSNVVSVEVRPEAPVA